MNPVRALLPLALLTLSAPALAGYPPGHLPLPVPAAPVLAPGFHAVSCGVDGHGATRAEALRACEAAVKRAPYISKRRCACRKNADVIEIAPGARPAFWVANWTFTGATPAAAWARCVTWRDGGQRMDPKYCEVNSAWGPFERRHRHGEFDDPERYRWLMADGTWVDEAGEGPCFTADTLVATPDGERPIAALRVGDAIVSWSPDAAASDVVARVVRTKERAAAELLALTFEDGRVLRATPNHPLHSVRRGFVPAGELVVGEAVAARAADGALTPLTLVAVAREPGPVVVYDVTVAPTHTLFAGGVWAHNY
ncbi:MAG: hypothetical protein EP329_01810 [Deltaproteobacteria bacterium]|nr:MAG: hypothetical protein EP329_01810 [Deltaproteobacteria bacterium]